MDKPHGINFDIYWYFFFKFQFIFELKGMMKPKKSKFVYLKYFFYMNKFYNLVQ
jgi:hypothetical protein